MVNKLTVTYLSTPWRAFLAGSARRVVKKGKSKTTVSLQTDDMLKPRSTKVCHKIFHGRVHLKNRG